MNQVNSEKVIILDRDGVINHDSDNYIKTVDEWHPIDGSIEIMGRLYSEGYRLFIFTCQSGIARGYYTIETMQDIHNKMAKLLAKVGAHVEAIFFCPHKPGQHCKCRKPKTGMLRELSTRYEIDLSKTWVVGDSWRDIESGQRVNANIAIVKTGKGSKVIKEKQQEIKENQIPVFKNLEDFGEQLLAGKL